MLRGSEGGEPGTVPHAAPPLWASAPSAAWEEAQAPRALALGPRCYETEAVKREEGYVCVFVFVCVLLGDPKQICLPVINSPD